MSATAPASPVSELLPLRAALPAVVVAGLGYFVDVFDLILFAVVRVASVRDLRVGARALEVGTLLQNAQLLGMFAGGILFGVLGDRRGRRAILYGSILTYSLATLANATATTVAQYVVWRFIAGVGLAGELGAAITIVSELVAARDRGAATALVASLGVLGAIGAALVAELVPWRTAYVIGGVLGLLLLLVRFRLQDAPMFLRVRAAEQGRGDLRRLVASRERLGRYLRAIAVGVPIWFGVGILITFAPEFAAALGVTGPVTAGRAVLWFYVGTSTGDLLCGLLSQRLRSRRRALALFLALDAVGVVAYLTGLATTPLAFHAICGWLGFATGYWAVLITMAAEQFGTDLRATVATSVPNLVRTTAVPMTLAFLALRPAAGLAGAAAIVGAVAFALALAALRGLAETYGRDLDFVER